MTVDQGGMEKFIAEANRLGEAGEPFLFMIDFEKQSPRILPFGTCHGQGVYFDIEGVSNIELDPEPIPYFNFHVRPVPFDRYTDAFSHIMGGIHYGDSYLANLCFPTEVETNLTLRDVFRHARARYKLLVDDAFMVFSPESFVRIREGRISTFPMKGTIDAGIPDAKQRILGNEKEMAEHATIVDLLRNDLNMVARQVRVERYRYVEEVPSWNGKLLQVSSHITGELPDGYTGQLGTILDLLTPAGSVSGAPKQRTTALIREAEKQARGYFTGVFGIFDGAALNSGVMIRFLEKSKSGYRYWSGGGVTSQSRAKAEYDELIQKVYVPIY